ncbi:hypothetical protein U1Q18_021034 [Sarracenia purpurea var. burkii]
MAEVTKLLYIVVVDDEESRAKGKESFRYTRPVLQSTLQLMGCKARHAFKELDPACVGDFVTSIVPFVSAVAQDYT